LLRGDVGANRAGVDVVNAPGSEHGEEVAAQRPLLPFTRPRLDDSFARRVPLRRVRVEGRRLLRAFDHGLGRWFPDAAANIGEHVLELGLRVSPSRNVQRQVVAPAASAEADTERAAVFALPLDDLACGWSSHSSPFGCAIRAPFAVLSEVGSHVVSPPSRVVRRWRASS
jgi:hypothetical protein